MRKKEDVGKKSPWGWILWTGLILSLIASVVIWKVNQAPPPYPFGHTVAPVNTARPATPTRPAPPPLAPADYVVHAGEVQTIKLSDESKIIEIAPMDNPCLRMRGEFIEGDSNSVARMESSNGRVFYDSPTSNVRLPNQLPYRRLMVTGHGRYTVSAYIGTCTWDILSLY